VTTVIVSNRNDRREDGRAHRVRRQGGHLGRPGARRSGGIADADDRAYLEAEVGGALLGCLAPSPWVRAGERGAVAPVSRLEPENLAVLGSLLAALHARERDWAAYHSATVAFHLRNAVAWGGATGADLAAQIDPEFVPGALARS
jgi:CO dehydrogenase maturation factor